MDLSKCGGICRGACKHYAIGVECPPEATYEPRELKPITLSDIKEWMQVTEGKGGAGRRDLMKWLIAEVEGLSLHGKTWEKVAKDAHKQIEKLKGALKEVSGCHGNHGTPKLCDGCLISIYDALDEDEPDH